MMRCEEVQEKLEAYFDGELGPSEHAAVEEALPGCPECQESLRALTSIRTEMRASMEENLAEVRFDGLWEGIVSDIRKEEGVQVFSEPSPGMWERFAGGFGWRGLVPLGAAALALMIAFSGDWGAMNGEAPFPMPQDNVAFVSAVQFEEGTVFIDQDPNDATAALIVWHTTDES